MRGPPGAARDAGLAGLRVSELCQLDNRDMDLAKARIHIRESKTEAGVRTVDIQPRLLGELVRYQAHRGPAPVTRWHTPQQRQRAIAHDRPPSSVAPTNCAPSAASRRSARTSHRPRPSAPTSASRSPPAITVLRPGSSRAPAPVRHAGDLHTTLAIYTHVIRESDRDRQRCGFGTCSEFPRLTSSSRDSAEVCNGAASATTERPKEQAGHSRLVRNLSDQERTRLRALFQRERRDSNPRPPA